MLSRSGRPFAQIVFGPFAKLFIKLGISANAVTVSGTLLASLVVLTLIPTNHLILGPLLVTVVMLFDHLDGQIARITNTASEWGAFLDSTLDRIADAATFSALLIWGFFWAAEDLKYWVIFGALAALIFGALVPYVRARAEAIGKQAGIGIAERADRLVAIGICTLLVGCGLPQWILAAGLWLIAFFALVTVIQRMVFVYQQCQN